MAGKSKQEIEQEKQRQIYILLNAVKKPDTKPIQSDK